MKEYSAPYFPVLWLDEFLKLVKRIRVDKVDRKWIAGNNICSETNASKVVTGLKFLKLIDEQGYSIPNNLNPLKLQGEPYKEALQKIVKEAYTDLLAKVDITQAYPTDVLNYFISKHQYSKPSAQSALVLFLHLASRAGLELSNELTKRKTSQIPSNKETPIKISSRRPRNPKNTQNFGIDSFTTAPGGETPSSAKILISVRGKGLNHSQEVNSLEELETTLEILKKIIELNLKKE